jgi:hypothetical protein
MPFYFHCFSYSVDFSPSLRAGRRRDADYHRALAGLSGNSRHAALRRFEHSPTSNIAYRGNSEALIHQLAAFGEFSCRTALKSEL